MTDVLQRSSMTPNNDSSSHELPPPVDVHSNPSHAVISRKERNGLNQPNQTDMAACNSGNMTGKETVQGPSPLLLGIFRQGR